MTRDELVAAVKMIICNQFGVSGDKVDDDTDLMNDLGGDSLDHVEVTMELEDEFEITIADVEIEKITKFSEIVKLLETKVDLG